MTDDEIDMRILRAIARGVSHPTRHAVATALGIIPPRFASIDAGRPWPGGGSDWSDLPANTDRAQIAALGEGGKG